MNINYCEDLLNSITSAVINLMPDDLRHCSATEQSIKDTITDIIAKFECPECGSPYQGNDYFPVDRIPRKQETNVESNPEFSKFRRIGEINGKNMGDMLFEKVFGKINNFKAEN